MEVVATISEMPELWKKQVQNANNYHLNIWIMELRQNLEGKEGKWLCL